MAKKCKSNIDLPRCKNRSDAEKRLLKAGEDVFSLHGFNGATTRMIAAEAGLNISLITRYFGGKYGLLLKIVESKRKKILDSALPYPSQDNLTDECWNYTRFRVDQLTENLTFLKIVFTQFLTDPTFLQLYLESPFSMLLQNSQLRDRVQRLIDEGRSRLQLGIEKTLNILEQHIMGTVLLQMIIKSDSKEELLLELNDFVTALMFTSDCTKGRNNP